MQLKCLPSISKHCPKSLVHTCQQQACTADQYYTTSLSMAWHVFITLIQMEKEMSLSVSGTCILMLQIFIIASCKNCKNLFCPIQCWQRALVMHSCVNPKCSVNTPQGWEGQYVWKLKCYHYSKHLPLMQMVQQYLCRLALPRSQPQSENVPTQHNTKFKCLCLNPSKCTI